MEKCVKYIGRTLTGKQCKRFSSCKINCGTFCWQHAKSKNLFFKPDRKPGYCHEVSEVEGEQSSEEKQSEENEI